MAARKPALPPLPGTLLSELRGLNESARQQVAQAANATLTMLYWHVGQRVQREVLKNERAEYGEQIVSTLPTQLVAEYGQAFGARSLRRMVQFAEVFPNENTVATLSRELSWSHFIEILPLKQPLEREYYAELCRVERWSVRTLRERIASQLYLRTAIAKQPDAAERAEISHLRDDGQRDRNGCHRLPPGARVLPAPAQRGRHRGPHCRAHAGSAGPGPWAGGRWQGLGANPGSIAPGTD